MEKQVCGVDSISRFPLCYCEVKSYQFENVDVDTWSGYSVATVLHLEVCSNIY